MKQISWSPRAFVFKGLLNDTECDYLINNVSRAHPPVAWRRADVSMGMLLHKRL